MTAKVSMARVSAHQDLQASDPETEFSNYCKIPEIVAVKKNPETSMHTLLQNMNCTAEGKQGSLGRRPVLKQFTVLSLSEALRSAFGSKTC